MLTLFDLQLWQLWRCEGTYWTQIWPEDFLGRQLRFTGLSWKRTFSWGNCCQHYGLRRGRWMWVKTYCFTMSSCYHATVRLSSCPISSCFDCFLVTVVAQANFVVRICLVANHLHFLILRDSFSLQDGQCLSDVNPIKSRSFFFYIKCLASNHSNFFWPLYQPAAYLTDKFSTKVTVMHWAIVCPIST